MAAILSCSSSVNPSTLEIFLMVDVLVGPLLFNEDIVLLLLSDNKLSCVQFGPTECATLLDR